jgi:hypothetical protein
MKSVYDTIGVAVMQSSSSEHQVGQDARSARRRLIRGAFAAPAALTLYSGSAAAAASHCVARRVMAPVNPGQTTTALEDVYVRVQVRTKGTGLGSSTWVFGGDVLTATGLPTGKAAQSFLFADDWYGLAAGDSMGNSSGYAPGQRYTNASATANEVPQPLASTFVALRFDTEGKIVAVTDTVGASAVSRSCWTSFAKTI